MQFAVLVFARCVFLSIAYLLLISRVGVRVTCDYLRVFDVV